jgi:hypothetical protein
VSDHYRSEYLESQAEIETLRADLAKARAWSSTLCSMHRSPDISCRICNPMGTALTVAEISLAKAQAENERLRERSAKVREKLDEIFVGLDGAHQAHCFPTWTAYGRHNPGQSCELIATVREAVAILEES